MKKRKIKHYNSFGNKLIYGIAALLIVIAIMMQVRALTTGTVQAPNPGHNSTQVFVSLGGGDSYITLQTAIDYGYLLGQNLTPMSNYVTSIDRSKPYEYASQILVTFKGQTMTLQQAIDSRNFVTNSVNAVYGGGSYATVKPSGGEIGSSININTSSGIKTLQGALNEALALLSSACLTGYVCPQGQKIGNPCYPSTLNSLCVNTGTITSLGTCTGYTYTARGTACQDNFHACDGAGQCSGWSGSGCAGLPAGYIGGSGQLAGVTCASLKSGGSNYVGNNGGGTWYKTNQNVRCSHSCGCGTSCSTTCGDTWYIKPGASSVDNSCYIAPQSSGGGGGSSNTGSSGESHGLPSGGQTGAPFG